jgi:mRNA-degrading endonuclease toxin of MazEF toxin-antitoxin module
MVGIGHAVPPVGPARGDVYVVDLPDVGGHVMRGVHPVVIVRSDRLQRSATVMVVPMTSAPKAGDLRPPYLVVVTGRESGLPRDGFAKCDQVLCVPATSCRTLAGRLSPAAMDRIDASLRFTLAL